MNFKLSIAFAAVAAFVTSVMAVVDVTTPGWYAEPMSANGDTIRTDGELVYAIAGGQPDGNSVGEITVNGVPFTTVRSFTDYPSSLFQWPISVSPQLPYDVSGLGTHSVSDSGYAQMLDKGFRNISMGSYTFTLTGLEAGETYLVQIVCHRNTNGGYHVSAPDGTPSIGTGWDTDGYTYGGTIVGVFNATDTTYSFTLTYSGNSNKADFNAFQVRKLSGVPIEPSIGTMTATPNGNDVTITLGAIVMGTDDSAVPATSYSVSYWLGNNNPTVLADQTGASTAFAIENLADGLYTCSAAITTDKGKTSVTNSVGFRIGAIPAPVWTAEPMSNNGKTIHNEGNQVWAYCKGNTGASDSGTYTVNSVVFSGIGESYCGDFNFRNKDNSGWYRKVDGTPVADVYGDYASLLNYGFWAPQGDCKLKMNNLTVDNTYLVQIVVCSPNYDTYAWAPDVEVGSETGFARAKGTDWEYGGSLTGIFTATNTTQEFTIKYSNANCYFNAVQLRDLTGWTPPEAEVIEPAIESVNVETDGSSATISITGVEMGTDDECDNATEYFVTYTLDGGLPVNVLTNQTSAGAVFKLRKLSNGAHTCSIRITTDKNKTSAAQVANFTTDSKFDLIWTAEPMDENGDKIRTKGELVYAYCGSDSGDQGGWTNTVNGVDFVAHNRSGWSVVKPMFSAEHILGMDAHGNNSEGVADPGYARILNDGWWYNASGEYAITLNGLEPNVDYIVQMFFHQRNSDITVAAPYDEAFVKVSGDDWTYGGSLTARFTAFGPSTQFKLTYSGGSKAILNAIQVRKLKFKTFILMLK